MILWTYREVKRGGGWKEEKGWGEKEVELWTGEDANKYLRSTIFLLGFLQEIQSFCQSIQPNTWYIIVLVPLIKIVQSFFWSHLLLQLVKP